MKTIWSVDLSHPSGDDTRATIEDVAASTFMEAAALAFCLSMQRGLVVEGVCNTDEPADGEPFLLGEG